MGKRENDGGAMAETPFGVTHLYRGCNENRSFDISKNSGSHSEQSISVGKRTYKVLSGVRKRQRTEDQVETLADERSTLFTGERSSVEKSVTVAGRILNFSSFTKVELKLKGGMYPVTVHQNGYYRIDKLPRTRTSEYYTLVAQADGHPPIEVVIRVPGTLSQWERSYDIRI